MKFVIILSMALSIVACSNDTKQSANSTKPVDIKQADAETQKEYMQKFNDSKNTKHRESVRAIPDSSTK